MVLIYLSCCLGLLGAWIPQVTWLPAVGDVAAVDCAHEQQVYPSPYASGAPRAAGARTWCITR